MYHSFKSLALAAGTTALVFGTVASAQAATIYTDRTAWQAAVDAITGSVTTTDTFSTDIGSAQSINLDSGIVSTNSTPPTLPNTFNNNSVAGGVYLNATGGSTASATITWALPTSAFAFGADFVSVNNPGLTLTGNFDGTGDQSFNINTEIGGSTGFFGVIGTADFSSIVFGNAGTSVDSFSIDDASVASAPPALPVPEPGTVMALALMGSGLFLSRQGKRG